MPDKYAGTAVYSLTATLAPFGLITRGGFHPGPADSVPGDPRTVLLVGNAGPAMWRAFQGSGMGSLDAWVRDAVDRAAAICGAEPLYPFDGPPFLPFQRWAQRAAPVHPSPIGVLIHPDYGLWHAWRAALAFADRLDLPAPQERPSPCATCAVKPCLATCPVGAFTRAGYNVPACTAHIDRPSGTDCLLEGCRARRACPVGTEWRYVPAQAEFHMRAFRRA